MPREAVSRTACFVVPLLTAIAVLYQPLAGLGITMARAETLVVIGVTLLFATGMGLLAAFGGTWLRLLVLTASAVIVLDLVFQFPPVFESMQPEARAARARDARRLRDVEAIKRALGEYIDKVGPLPTAEEYGEGEGPQGFWRSWWDFSSYDLDGDGIPFLDFLAESGIMESVPTDPAPVRPEDGDPRGGQHYTYFVVPPEYMYEGGVCEENQDLWIYMLTITNLETESERPPKRIPGSGCECLWRDRPNFFQGHFDYVTCGTFAR